MADDTAADAKTGDGSQKKKKKKRNEADSDETAPKHLKKKKKKKVRRNAAEAGLQPSRRIPSHPTASPTHRCKNAYFLTLAFSLSRVLVVAHRLSRPRTRLTIHLSCHLTDFSRTGLPNMLPGEITIKRAHRRIRRIYWCFTTSCWQTRWPSSGRKIHQRGAK